MEDEDQSSKLLNVSCRDHHDALVSGLWNFFQTKHKTDFAFQGNGRSIRAHQLVAEVFLSPEKLGLGVLLDDQGCVDDQGGSLDSLLEFLYNGQVMVRERDLGNLLRVAKELEFDMLVEAVEATKLTVGTVRSKIIAGRATRQNTRRGRKGKPAKLLKTTATEKQISLRSSNKDGRTKRAPPARTRARLAKAKPPEPDLDDSSAEAHIGNDPSDESFHPESGEESTTESKQCVVEPGEADNYGGGDHAGVNKQFAIIEKIKRGRRRRQKTSDDDGDNDGSVEPKIDGRRLWLRKQPSLKCEHCSYETRRKNDYQVHLAKHNPTISIFRCETCCKKFLTDAQLEKHKRSHAGEPEFYDCPHCKYKSRDKTRYQVHLSKHDSSVVIFRCGSCSRAFLDEEGLTRHKVTHAGEPEIHECPYCECKFRNKIWYQVHLSKHDSNVVVFPCDVCGRPYLSREALERHKSRHRIYNCPHCDFVTPKCVKFHHHLRAIHKVNARGEPAAKKFKCNECEAAYMYESELKIHAVEKHSGAKPFKCNLCSFSSGRKSDVPKHHKAVHLGIKPCMCEACGYRCVSQSRLQQHSMKHTGEKPYKCETCSLAFGDRYTLKKHARLHLSDEKPYVCHVCGHAFNRRDNLKVHLKNVHKTPMDQQPPLHMAPVSCLNTIPEAYGMLVSSVPILPPPPHQQQLQQPPLDMSDNNLTPGFRNSDAGVIGWRSVSHELAAPDQSLIN